MSKAAELAALIGSQTALSNRNLIINGAMTLSQRGTSFDGAEQYLCDRWRFGRATDGYNLGWSQSTTAPDGFANSLKLDVTTADTSLNADVFALVQQRFEGQNLQMLKKGTSAAESVTVSFYVRSAKTGTYNLEMLDKDNSRHLIKAYTINSADTWEYKTVTFEGDTTGAFDNDNARSLDLNWWLAAGSNFNSGTRPTSWQAQDQTDRAVGQVNIFDSTSNDWYITGVQMELGSNASDFEHRSFGEELLLCQRYFAVLADGSANSVEHIGNGYGWSASQVEVVVNWPQEMRTTPALKQSTGTNYYQWQKDGSNIQNLNSLLTYQFTKRNGLLYQVSLSNVTAMGAYRAHVNNASAYLHLDAEL